MVEKRKRRKGLSPAYLPPCPGDNRPNLKFEIGNDHPVVIM
jgi:hypothetical protein